MSQTILITGASSGLGLAFLHHYAAQPTTKDIIALDINPLPSGLEDSLPNIAFYKSDISQENSISNIAPDFATTPIDLIIHCAGIRGLNGSEMARQKDLYKLDDRDVAKAETLQIMDAKLMMQTFQINTIGTFNIIKSFLPSLHLAPNPKVVILSSRMGSVAANTAGGGYAYRASKAALNAVVKSFSIDVPEVSFLLLHPGRVETGLVEWKEEGAISCEESLRDCLRVMEGMRKEDGLRLVDRFGVDIPW